jgi:LysM repeat protein
MSEQTPASADSVTHRCPQCDAVNSDDATQCILCAAPLTKPDRAQQHTTAATPAGRTAQRLRQDRYLPLKLVVGVICMIAVIAALQTWINPDPIAAVLYPSATPTVVRPTRTPTPIPTEAPIAQAAATEAPVTPTPTIAPTNTPQEPRFHQINSGDTLFSISLLYNVSVESLLELNPIDPSALQSGQNLQVPWPTPTPPLAPVEVDINGSIFIADPTDCPRYEVLGGDSLFGIAVSHNIDLQALLVANRLNEQAFINPGDTICIPTVYEKFDFGDDDNSAEIAITPTPTGPQLLFPQENAQLDDTMPLILQWLAQKDLADDEIYMVEVTDLTAVDSHPYREYVRQTSLQLPQSWQPPAGEAHEFRWRVRIVRITGELANGDYTFAPDGSVSRDGFFTLDSTAG